MGLLPRPQKRAGSEALRFELRATQRSHFGHGQGCGFHWHHISQTYRVARISTTHSSRPTQSQRTQIGRKHPSRDVIFSGQNLAKKCQNFFSLHDVLEPLKQALLASRDVIIFSQICGSNLQKVFTLGDGCWLPIQSSWPQDFARYVSKQMVVIFAHMRRLLQNEVKKKQCIGCDGCQEHPSC